MVREMFDALRAPEEFSTAYQHPVMRTVAWKNRADLAPEFLLELMHSTAGAGSHAAA
jgi:hypothetical protein